MNDVSYLIEVINQAHSAMMEADKEQPDAEEDQFQDGSNHGLIEGKIAAYRDITTWAARRIIEDL